MTVHRPITHCVLCRSTDLDLAVPMKPMPATSPNLKSDVFEMVPLNLMLCKECGHVQTSHMLDPEFNYGTYVYRTSSSPGLVDHFRELARTLIDRHDLKTGDLVVEVGSNDGSLLHCFKEKGLRVLGVDPATKIAREATASGIPTLSSFFGAGIAREILATEGPADLIIANNVLANLEDLSVFTEGVETLLSTDGALVFETQYGPDVFEKMLLDTIYPEHVSYFAINPLGAHFAQRAMGLSRTDRVDTKGGSIRVSIGRGRAFQHSPHESRTVNVQAALSGFAERIENLRAAVHRLIDREGKTIAGYGASVGTVALLHQLGLQHRIHCLYDDNTADKPPFLKGPGYEIPIHPGDRLEKDKPSAVLVFAWRYASMIADKHPTTRFIVPLPTVHEHVRRRAA